MSEQHEHCWHDTGVMLTSNPPQVVDKCCFCGVTRGLHRAVHVPRGNHGPYAPFTEPVGGIVIIGANPEGK